METAPSLRGYVRFISKPTAETILTVDEKDPLLVRWQYGLGRAVVFTSDAKSRWAANWMNWPGFDKLWTNLFRDLLPHAAATEATAEMGRLPADDRPPARAPDMSQRRAHSAGEKRTGSPPIG